MFIENRPAEYVGVMRPLMLNELIPAAASTTIVALLGMMALILL
jgi:hypothetical protein